MCLQEQLLEKGWRSAPRAIADAMTDALMGWEMRSDPGERRFPAERSVSDVPLLAPDAAHQLIENGLTVVDPEHLVVDATGGYPPEIVAVVQFALDRVFRYANEQPFGN